MRCRNCNVDLSNKYTKCPLCGSSVFDDNLLLGEIPTAPYPDYKNGSPRTKNKVGSNFPQKAALRTALAVCAVFAVASAMGYGILWSIATPLLFSAVAVLYLITGLREKGKMLHSAVALLGVLLSVAVSIIISLILKSETAALLITICVPLTALAVLAIFKPENFRNQLKAFFHI